MKLLWQLILRPLLPPSLIDYPFQLPYSLDYFFYLKLLPYPRWVDLAYFTGVLRGSIFASLEVKLRSFKMYFFPFSLNVFFFQFCFFFLCLLFSFASLISH